MGWFTRLKKKTGRVVSRTARGSVGKGVMRLSRSKLAKGVLRGAAGMVPGGTTALAAASMAAPLMKRKKRAPAAVATSFVPQAMPAARSLVPPLLGLGLGSALGSRVKTLTRGEKMNRKAVTRARVLTTAGTGGTGLLPKGPGGKFQFPWNDPNTPGFLKAFSLDDQYLRTYYRAPHGYVVVRDPNGKPYPMLKWAAQKFGLWTPGKKPPISVGEHQAIKRADRAVKKIRKTMIRVARVDKSVSKGKVVCKKRK